MCPKCGCSASQIHQEQKQHRACSVCVEWAAWVGGRWRAEVFLIEHSAGGVSALLGSQNQGRKEKGQGPNWDRSSVLAGQAVPRRLLLHLRLHSVPREGVVATSKLNQEPDGLGLQWKHRPTIRSLTTTFTGEKEIIVCKKKQTKKKHHKLVCHWGNALQQISTHVAGGIPIQGPVSGTSQHTTSTGPSINPLRLFLNGTLLNFAEVTISFARVALFQAEGGPSFVPLGVLLPFSLEETAAPAERREERWRDITRMRRRGKRHKEAEPPQISMQNITTKNFYFSTWLQKLAEDSVY